MDPIASRLFATLPGAIAGPWVERVLGVVEGGDRAAFGLEFAAAARRLGRADLSLSAAARAELAALGVTLPDGLTVDELGRIAMLASLPEPEQAPLADDCFRSGDARERRAVLRALPLLPRPERFLALATSACRTHVLPVFEAICCESPYPASFFPDASFNQMVLKALFLGVALHRVEGLAGRRTPELDRMVGDYAAERTAAGRAVPPDIDLHFAAAAMLQRRSP